MAVKIEKKAFSKPINAPSELVESSANSELKEQPVIATTTKANKALGVAEETANVVGVVHSTEPLCNVGVQAKQTVNMGNYNSITIGVSIHIPCSHHLIDTTYLEAKHFVDTKMGELMEEVEKAKES